MRLLVAADFPPNAPGGGPAVVRQMLRGWPAADLFWWSCLPETSGARLIEVAGHQCGCPPGRLQPHHRWTHLKAWLMESYWARRAARDLQRTMDDVQPDALWVIPHNWSILPLHRVLAAKGKAKGPHFHTTIQDYPDVHGNASRWGVERTARLARAQETLYAAATTRDATSLPMLEDLEERTGSPGIQMLHQGLEREDFEFLEQSAIENPKSAILKIAYAGTILVMPEFELFVRALARIREQTPVELHLYGAHSYSARNWFDSQWMIEHGNFSERELLGALRSCDWGFIPMALDNRDSRYNRYSFPTKFITYLAAGLPVIALGHPQCSVVRMAGSYNIGLCSSATNPDLWPAQLAGALQQENAKARHRGEVLRCAREHFSAETMRQRLHGCFRSR